jgi:uncharacterized cupredoxin-like copper-binding protein
MKLQLFGTALLLAVSPLLVQAASIVNVTLKDNAVLVDQSTIHAGPVTFNVSNAGLMPHEFVVLQTDAPQDQLPMNASGSKAKEKGMNKGEIEDIAAGQSASKEYTLAAGHYVLLCNMAGHYMLGMHIGLTVQ